MTCEFNVGSTIFDGSGHLFTMSREEARFSPLQLLTWNWLYITWQWHVKKSNRKSAKVQMIRALWLARYTALVMQLPYNYTSIIGDATNTYKIQASWRTCLDTNSETIKNGNGSLIPFPDTNWQIEMRRNWNRNWDPKLLHSCIFITIGGGENEWVGNWVTKKASTRANF